MLHTDSEQWVIEVVERFVMKASIPSAPDFKGSTSLDEVTDCEVIANCLDSSRERWIEKNGVVEFVTRR